ncbi:hypothetical protein BHU72_00740 [Desulfuribacillus stibiiarsenatis]|uniref:Serine aminopeptidase S33 domain-containing protein n=1 Tax=Desulfuribacillus stibiiarsenatis TaxID=1390249 RepID=A0A1E5L9J3_9FIRM|nr:alpha/beta fold hydrolase [Desulfuribacillus stibiiarsenatis]OEH86827.1 hypothetical protein BHU72_00740 [Desulfuribacillus stibiiarsenatis]
MIVGKSRDSFFLPGGNIGILLIHGFTGSPAEMHAMGEYLHRLGYTVYAPLLAGHGTTVQDMAKTCWTDWWQSVTQGYEKLKLEGCTEIIGCGLSMGGILTLKLALNYPLKALVTMCAPIYLTDSRAYLSGLLKYVKKYQDKNNTHPYEDMEAYQLAYQQMPLACIPSLLELINQVRPLIRHIETPALVLQSELDQTVQPKSGEYIFQELRSWKKEYITYSKSGHIITIDKERKHVFQDVANFLGFVCKM